MNFLRAGLRGIFNAGYSYAARTMAFLDYKGRISPRLSREFRAYREYLLTPQESERHAVVFYEDLRMTSHDGVRLSANLFLPQIERHDRLPTLIYVSSWVLDKNEYIARCIEFAEKGYVVFAYTTRGFGKSGGNVGIGSPEEIRDVSAVIDWLETNTQADPTRVGVTGISYGAYMALLAAAFEPRIAVVTAMSGGVSLSESLYGAETPSNFWSLFLFGTGSLLGRLAPDVGEQLNNGLAHRKLDEAMAWARARSPSEFVQAINANGTKIFFVHNWLDYLFKPDTIFSFFNQLTTPKKLWMSDGIHFLTEMIGLSKVNDPGWREVHAWFDHWLVEKNTSWDRERPIELGVRRSCGTREKWASWPAEFMRRKTYYLDPTGSGASQGLLLASTPSTHSQVLAIRAGFDLDAGTGMPVLGSILDAYLNHPVQKDLASIDPRRALVHLSEPLGEVLSVRGPSELTLDVSASSAKMQLTAYLYDVSPQGVGSLISHAVTTVWDFPRGERQALDLHFMSTAYNVARGHRIGLVIDTFDVLYGRPTRQSYRVSFHFDRAGQAQLSIPYVEAGDVLSLSEAA